jgi:hypothetical protein
METPTVSYDALIRILNRPGTVATSADGAQYAWECGCKARRITLDDQFAVSWCDGHRLESRPASPER